MTQWARGLLVAMRPIAALLDTTHASVDYEASLDNQLAKVADQELTPSARMLRDIAFAAVKLDPDLTAGIEGSGPGADRIRATVAAVVDMTHALGATVIAEAVESAAQMRALRHTGCDALQGWLLGGPEPLP